MSATQELIAAALTAADELDEIFGWMKATKSRTAADLREACARARAMVQPAPDMAEPFVVRHYSGDERPSIKGNGFDGLEIGETRGEAEQFIAFVNARCSRPPPDMAEVERLADGYASAVHDGRDKDCVTGRNALLAHIQRGAVPEGWQLVPKEPTDSMLRAIRRQRSGGRIGAGDRADWSAWLAAAPDQFRDAAKMVPAASDPDPLHLSRILHELAGAASMCWTPRPSTAVFDSQQAIVFVEQAIAEIRQRMQMVSAAPQPVGEPCRAAQPTGWRCTRTGGHESCALVREQS